MAEIGEITTQSQEIQDNSGGQKSAEINSSPDPTQEMSEIIKNKVDVLMVFGQGPVKPLMMDGELTDEQRSNWVEFKKDPLHNTEPDFRVIEGEAWTKQLEGKIPEEQNKLIAGWQQQGRFGLNRWGRENALAAGLSLVSGQSERVLLSGGKTIPAWAKESLPAGRLDTWPSEAELMKDIIVRRFGRLYEKNNPGKKIEDVLILEDASTNTLENVANTLNENPDIMKDSTKLGLLATNFHIERSEKIAALFAPGKEVTASHGAQDLLEVRNENRQEWRKKSLVDRLRNKGTSEEVLKQKVNEMKTSESNKTTYRKMLEWMNSSDNPDLIARNLGEKRFMIGLSDPEYINYWLGYIGLAGDPRILQNTIQGHKKDEKWTEAARGAFRQVGLDFDEIAEKDLLNSPDEFKEISSKLTMLKEPDFRTMPPLQTS